MSLEARTVRVLTVSGAGRGLALGLMLGPGELHLGTSVLGVALPAALGLTLLLGVPLAGQVSDRLGRRQTVALGLVLAGSGFLLLGFGPDPLLRFIGALAVVGLPLEPAAAAWLRESVVEQRRSPVIGRLLAVSSLGLILGMAIGLSLLSAPGFRWPLAALALGLCGLAGWVLRVRTDPPVGHRLPAALDPKRWEGWLRLAPGAERAVGLLCGGIAALFAAAFLLQPVLVRAPGNGEAYWPWLLVLGALAALGLVTRIVERTPPWIGPALAGLGIGLGLGLETLFFEPILTFLPPSIGAPVGALGWLLLVAVLLTVGPSHLIVRLPDDHRGDTPVLLLLCLGVGVLTAGTARILLEAGELQGPVWLLGVAGFGLLGLILWVLALRR